MRRLARPRVAVVVMAVELAMFATFAALYLSPVTPRAVWDSAGGPSTLLFVVPFSAFAVAGATIAYRRPANRVGWLILFGAGSLGLGAITALVASVLTHAHNAAGEWVGLGGILWAGGLSPTSILFVLALVSFPDGHLPSRRWRWLVSVTAVVAAANAAVFLVDPAPGAIGIGFTGDASVNATSPLAVQSLAGTTNVLTTNPLTNAAQYVIELLAVLSIFLRLRGADTERRQQIRWFATGAAMTVASLAVTSLLPYSGNAGVGLIVVYSAITVAGTLAFPVAIAVAMLKYRLYDIDVVISRALVYGVLAAFITAVYVGIAVGIGALVGSGGKPNLGLSILATAIVAAGFQPVRHRVQGVANRLVYGRRATPYEALSQFSERAAESYALDDVLPRMARVLAEGTGAQRADVWLRSGEILRVAAAWPDGAAPHEALAVDGGALPPIAGADCVVAVRHQGELLGALSVTKRAGESLTPVEENLVDHLAGQAGLVLRNVRLTSDLHARLDELRASRQRLVTAQDDARRRLERNLHDGAQQHLVALKVKLGLAEMLLARDPPRATATLAELKSDADGALETLRDLARGIYPPLLADRGLTIALESHVRKLALPATVDAQGVGRYPEDVEAAVYFAVLEALQNAQKYAQASAIAIRLQEEHGTLVFSVSDDGRGFDSASTARGAGLTNMEDRLAATGGSLVVESIPTKGTTVRGHLPLGAAPGAALPLALQAVAATPA